MCYFGIKIKKNEVIDEGIDEVINNLNYLYNKFWIKFTNSNYLYSVFKIK